MHVTKEKPLESVLHLKKSNVATTMNVLLMQLARPKLHVVHYLVQQQKKHVVKVMATVEAKKNVIASKALAFLQILQVVRVIEIARKVLSVTQLQNDVKFAQPEDALRIPTVKKVKSAAQVDASHHVKPIADVAAHTVVTQATETAFHAVEAMLTVLEHESVIQS